MKSILINAEPLDKQYAGIHYYLKLLRSGFEKYFPDYPIYYIREKKKSGSSSDLVVPSLVKLQRDPFKHFIAIPGLVRKLKPDIYIELTHFGPFFIGKKTKRVSVIHDLTPIKYPEFHPFLSASLQKFFIRHTVRNAKLVVVNSKNTRNDVINFLPEAESKVKIVYPAVEDIFKPVINKDILKKFGITSKYFLSLSTIEPRKNIGTLLTAFKFFKEKTKNDNQLVLVGKAGWKNKSFFELLNNHPYKNDIILTGYVERKDLPALYSSAKVFVFPSFYEGFGLPVLEALACGTPCIISSTSSLPEVGGDAALYFDPNSLNELVEKMELIYNNEELRIDLSEKAIKQASKFSLEKFAKEFICLLDE